MKKKLISIALFALVFIATYLIICFVIPGMRIKLHAEPVEYIVESIKHMAFFKFISSFVVAFIVVVMRQKIMKK